MFMMPSKIQKYISFADEFSSKGSYTGRYTILGGVLVVALGCLFFKDAKDEQKELILKASYRDGDNIKLPDTLSPREWKPLIDEMVQLGDIEALKELIDRFQDGKYSTRYDEEFRYEEDLMKSIIKKRDLKLVREVFPLIARINANQPTRSAMYYKPIKNGDLELVKAMVDGKIPLSRDVRMGYIYSLHHGDHLLFAMALGQYNIVEYLLKDCGYDITKSYPFLLESIEFQDGKGSFDDEIPGSLGYISPAFMVLYLNDPALLKLFKHLNITFDPKVALDCRDGFGFTTLIRAVKDKNMQLARRLLDKKVDPNSVSMSGESALTYATRGGNVFFIELLIKYGAKVDLKNNSQKTLWHIADENHHGSIVFPILKKHIPEMIEDVDCFGVSPLAYAINYRDVESVKLLIKNGASVSKISTNKGGHIFDNVGFFKGELITLQEFAEAHLRKLTFEWEQLKKESPNLAIFQKESYDAQFFKLELIIGMLKVEEIEPED
jgi:hypothetical protein